MITLSMDAYEIDRHYRKDEDMLYQSLQNYIQDFKRIRKKFPKTKYKIYRRTSDGTRQKYIFVVSDIVCHKGQYMACYVLLAEVCQDGKRYYMMMKSDNEGGYYEIFADHVLRRFNERMNMNLEHDRLLCEFFSRQHCVVTIYNQDKRHVSATLDGILLGEQNKDKCININKTFVSKDLLKTSQIDAFSKLESSLAEHNEDYRERAQRNGFDYDNIVNELLRDVTISSIEAERIYKTYYE